MNIFRKTLIVVGVLAAASAVAGVNEWTRTGPSGAALYSVHYVDGAGTALAINFRNIYRTTDHGVNWTRVLSNPFGHVPLLSVNPTNANQAVAVLDGVYRSSDGGATWTAVANPGVPVVVNGERPQSIAWTRDGSAVWIGTNQGDLYRSTDAGATWNLRAVSASLIYKMEVDAVDPNVVYALTESAIHRTTNGGESWATLSNDFPSWAPSRTHGGVVLATVELAGTVVRSLNYGDTYEPRSQEEPGVIYFAPGQTEVAYGTPGNGEVMVSADQGATWTARATVPDLSASQLAISPSDPDRLLVVTQTGIYGSSDGGQTWEPRNRGMNERPMVDLHSRVLPDGGGQVFVIDRGVETIYRREAGGEWRSLASSPFTLLGAPINTSVFAAAPSDGTFYVGQPGHLAASTNDGASWQSKGHLGTAGTLAVDPADSQVLYAAATFDAAKSLDGGSTWSPIATSSGLPNGVVEFAVNDIAANKVYALVSGSQINNASPLYVSVDSGTTWNSAPPPVFNFRANAMAHEAGSTDTIYVGLLEGLFRTTDAGANWTRLEPYPQTNVPDGIRDIALDPRTPGILYVSTQYAYPAMRSVDAGQTWEPLLAAMGETNLIDKLIVDPTNPSRIIALAVYGGMLEMEIAPDLALTTSGGAMTAGSSSSATLTLTNNGAYTATAVRIDATLPTASNGYVVQASSGAICGVTGTTLLCEAPLLRPAASITATLTFTPTAAGQWQATAGAREPDSATANNSLNVTIQAQASNPPPASGGSGGGGGGGGGGSLDYLLLAGFLFLVIQRTRPLRPRFRRGACA